MRFAVIVAMLAGCGTNHPAPSEPLANKVVVAQPTTKLDDRCPHPPATGDEGVDVWMTAICKYTRRVCACTDRPCATKAGQDFGEEMRQWTKAHEGMSTQPSRADRAWMWSSADERAACSKRFTGELWIKPQVQPAAGSAAPP
jgi:hypothetical protein